MSDTRTQFGLQLGAWLALSAIYFALDLAAQLQPDAPVHLGELAVRACVWGLCGWLVSLGAWAVWRRVAPEEWSPATLVGAAAIGGLGSGALWLLVFTLIDASVGLEPGFVPLSEWEPATLLAEGITFVFPMMAWHGVAFSLGQSERRADDRARAAEAEKLLERAKLDALRYQLNPHLLFNALNSAMAMIDEDPARAEDMLLRLTFLLRSALQAPREGSVADELERVRAYLELEGVRFESRLDVVSTVEPGVEAETLPTLLLQPLVENAIKHGMQRSSMPLRVRIDVQREGRVLVARVANSGSLGDTAAGPTPGDAGGGVGLANIRARVSALYGEGGSLRVEERVREGEAWVEAELRLDLRRVRSRTLQGAEVSP